MAGELERDGPDHQPETHETRDLAKPERHGEWVEHFRAALDKINAQRLEQDEAEIDELAETRGVSREDATEQWLDKRAEQFERGHQAHNLETTTFHLSRGTPYWIRDKSDQQEFLNEARAKQKEALEYFREGPVEGPDNQPVDPERIQPRLRWREGWSPPVDGGDITQRNGVLYERTNRRDWDNAWTGLGKPDSKRDPSLPPEQQQEKVDQMRSKAADVMGASAWSNSKQAGRMYDGLPAELKERFPHGVEFSMEGFPQLERYAIKTVQFEEGFRGPRREDDFRRANAIFGWDDEPDGTVWHHHEDGKTMQLVDEDLHGAIGHWGGVRASKQMGLWEGKGSRRDVAD